MESFEKIYVDEAHHIDTPDIYKLDNDEYIEELDDNESIDDTQR